MRKKKRVVKDKDVRIREIQNAAKQLFFKKGYVNTSVEQVAKKAKISKGALYQYFKNKDDLYYALMLPMFEKLSRLMVELENKLDDGKITTSESLFLEFSNVLMEVYNSETDAVRIYQVFQLNGLFSRLSSNTNKLLNMYGNKNYGIMRRVFEKCLKKGLISTGDPVVLADIVWASFLGIIQVEENKLKHTKKNHIQSTLKSSLLLLSRAVS